jgi:hypothetical protein
VKAVFDAYPAGLRTDLLALRQLIFDTARETQGVGPLVETLKWGQPSYLPSRPRVGTTIRIDGLRSRPGAYAMFLHCTTTLVADLRELYADDLTFEGNRALVLAQGARLPRAALRHAIGMALTYHARRRP